MDSHYDRVVWLEGMFLSPQHFQQQERYLKHYSGTMLELFEPGRAGNEHFTHASFAPLLACLFQSMQHASQERVVHLEWDRRLF